MTKEKSNHIVVISPHQDDALISLGETMLGYAKRTVLDIFTKSNSTIIGVDDTETATRLRHEEEQSASNKFDFKVREGGFSDSEVRGVVWDDVNAEINLQLLSEVADWVSNELSQLGEQVDLFIPAAFGLHPDHYLSLLIFLSEQLQSQTKQLAKNIFVYAEQPYQVDSGVLHNGISHLRDIETTPVSKDRKREMLNHYPSQLSPERVDKLSSIGLERYWHFPAVELDAMLQDSQLRGQEGNAQIFQSREFIEATLLPYAHEERTYENVFLTNLSGAEVAFPIVVESMNVDGKAIRVARQAGCDVSDYSNFDDQYVDDAILEKLLSTLRTKGVDIIWFSNIRTDSNFIHQIKATSQENWRLLTNIPAVGSHMRLTFDNWLSQKSKNMRRNVRRKRDLIASVALERGENVSYTSEHLSQENLSWLLDNQAIRSSSTSLDSLKDNQRFVQFLNNLIGNERVKIIKMQVGKEVISELLIFDDQESKTLSIYIQAMSSEWARYSPSFCAISYLIELAHSMGYLYVDFLRGEEGYKDHFVDSKKQMSKVVYSLNQSINIDEIASHLAQIEE